MRRRRFESAQYKETKKKVKQRENYKCLMCDKHTKCGHIHHIQRYANNPRLREHERNLCYLCYDCHKKTQGAEEYYAGFLMNKVREKYI